MTDPATKRLKAPGTRGAAMQGDRRQQQRARVRLAVVGEHSGGRFEGTTVDLGLGGMFVETDSLPEFGASVHLVLTLPTLPESLRLPGVVRWTKSHGFGLQFLQLGARDTYAIASFLKSIEETG